MRKVFLVLCCLILAGCAAADGSLNSAMVQRLAEVQEEEVPQAVYDHEFYAYYVEPSVGRVSSDLSGNTFMVDGFLVAMNLNVPAIINDGYYMNPAASRSGIASSPELNRTGGTYTDYKGFEHEYELVVYDVKEQAFTLFSSDTVVFYALSPLAYAVDLGGMMLKTARSLQVDHSAVIQEFSNRQKVTYAKKKLELFQYIAPESGVIDELFVEYNTSLGETYEWNSITGDEIDQPVPDGASQD